MKRMEKKGGEVEVNGTRAAVGICMPAIRWQCSFINMSHDYQCKLIDWEHLRR